MNGMSTKQETKESQNLMTMVRKNRQRESTCWFFTMRTSSQCKEQMKDMIIIDCGSSTDVFCNPDKVNNLRTVDGHKWFG